MGADRGRQGVRSSHPDFPAMVQQLMEIMLNDASVGLTVALMGLDFEKQMHERLRRRLVQQACRVIF